MIRLPKAAIQRWHVGQLVIAWIVLSFAAVVLVVVAVGLFSGCVDAARARRNATQKEYERNVRDHRYAAAWRNWEAANRNRWLAAQYASDSLWHTRFAGAEMPTRAPNPWHGAKYLQMKDSTDPGAWIFQYLIAWPSELRPQLDSIIGTIRGHGADSTVLARWLDLALLTAARDSQSWQWASAPVQLPIGRAPLDWLEIALRIASALSVIFGVAVIAAWAGAGLSMTWIWFDGKAPSGAR